MNWASRGVFHGKIPTDCSEFWLGVFKYETASETKAFKDLAIYAHTSLATPAICERVFSRLSCVKTKLRHRLKLGNLGAMIRILTSMMNTEKCYTEFEVILQMLTLSTQYQCSSKHHQRWKKLTFVTTFENMSCFSNFETNLEQKHYTELMY